MRVVHEENRIIVDCLDGYGPSIYKTRFDALLGHVERELGIKKRGPFFSRCEHHFGICF